MQIYFLCTQDDLCRIFEEQLTQEGHRCHLYTDQSLLFEDLQNLKTPPELLVLDYYLFNHDIFNIYDSMKKEHFHTPLIFYNDPCPILPEASLSWQKIIEMTTTPYRELSLDEYKPVLSTMERLIKENPHLLLPGSISGGRGSQYRRLLKIKADTGMRDALFCILEQLSTAGECGLTEEELIQALKAQGKSLKPASLRVELSQLKRAIQNSGSVHAQIIKSASRYRLLLL